MDAIDRQDAISIIQTWLKHSGYSEGERNVMGCTIQMLAELQSVEIVGCKDCKHRDPEDRKCDCGHDIMWQLPRDDNWFCADGERKADE